jgi:ATP-binding cassette subfamily C protein
MRFILSIIKAYPGQGFFMLIAMLMAGIVEGFGLSTVLPLLGSIVGRQTGTTTNISAAERLVNDSLQFVGLRPTLEVLLPVIFLAIVFKSGLLLVAKRKIGYIVAQVATDLRLSMLRSLLASRWEFHLSQPVGALANAIATEAQRSCKGFLCGALMLIAGIQAAIYLGVAFLVSWEATLAALGAGLFIFYALKSLMGKARRAGLRQTDLLKALIAHLTESLHSIKPLKAMGLEKQAESVLFKETTKLNKALRKQILSKEYLRVLQEPIQIGLLLIGLYAALTFLKLPFANLLILILLIGRVLSQLGKVQEEYQNMLIFESAYWSMTGKIREAEKDVEKGFGSQSPTLEKSIRLERINFAYGKKQVLRNVSLVFPAGMITAIVGPSGEGKTTIVDLAIGLLQPNKGEIWIDDLPLVQIDLRKWRRLIGYVPQETWLLHDTVLNNVTLGDPKLNEADAKQALRAAGAWEFVQAMPQGINSTVGERGGKISGGQRQRIAIARAIVHKPKLLILDEATTALDPENERAICKTLEQLRGGLTILAISHQPAVLEVADLAYRLKNGKAMPVEEVRSKSGLNFAEIQELNGLIG